MSKPELTFFCELDATALTRLFAEQALIDDLVAMGAGVSLGLLDLSDERAQVVRSLNRAGVPVVAWQLLPQEEGYWFNVGNADKAVSRYRDFQAWTAAHDLQWAGIGLDIEPDMREAEQLIYDRWRVAPALLRRLVDRARLQRAHRAYSALVAQARADGYRVESYQMPFIVDERMVGSTLLQRAGGLVDLSVDREVLMLYSSFVRPHGVGILSSYSWEAQAIGVGSTGGGVSLGGVDQIPPLTWAELTRDLRLASRRSRQVYVFSLEGCVSQGFLPRLKSLDWEEPVALLPEAEMRVDRLRGVVRGALWLAARPALIMAILTSLCLLAGWLRRKVRR